MSILKGIFGGGASSRPSPQLQAAAPIPTSGDTKVRASRSFLSQRAQAAGGRRSTIATSGGAQGLLGPGRNTTGKKSLLGV